MKKFIVVLVVIGVLVIMCGCNPTVKEIEASQTAFLIPLTGDTTQQVQFQNVGSGMNSMFNIPMAQK